MPQARTIKVLDNRYGDERVFLTVVTGTDKVMQPPSADTARAWADRFGLSHQRVLARFSTDTLPQHVLYSPTGEIVFRDSGLYDQDRILSILRAKTPVLNHWPHGSLRDWRAHRLSHQGSRAYKPTSSNTGAG